MLCLKVGHLSACLSGAVQVNYVLDEIIVGGKHGTSHRPWGPLEGAIRELRMPVKIEKGRRFIAARVSFRFVYLDA